VDVRTADEGGQGAKVGGDVGVFEFLYGGHGVEGVVAEGYDKKRR
jgi:hypothetical protein